MCHHFAAAQGKSTIIRRFGEVPGQPSRTVGVEVTAVPFGPLDVRRVRGGLAWKWLWWWWWWWW